MGKTHRQATISVYIASVLLKYASKSEAEFNEICKIAGVQPSILRDSTARISARQFETMANEALSRTGDDNFGLIKFNTPLKYT